MISREQRGRKIRRGLIVALTSVLCHNFYDKDYALNMGDAGETRVLRQDFPVEVAGVPLVDAQIVHGKPGRAQGPNSKVIQQITQENRHTMIIKPSPITRLSWIHGNRTLNAEKKRSSLIVYFRSEEAREAVIKNGITIGGYWYSVKL
jgi:hypothetical protein